MAEPAAPPMKMLVMYRALSRLHFNVHEVLALGAGTVATYVDADGATVIRIESLPRNAAGDIDLAALDALLRPLLEAL